MRSIIPAIVTLTVNLPAKGPTLRAVGWAGPPTGKARTQCSCRMPKTPLRGTHFGTTKRRVKRFLREGIDDQRHMQYVKDRSGSHTQQQTTHRMVVISYRLTSDLRNASAGCLGMTRKAKSRKSACASPETTRYRTVFQERACVPLAGWEFDRLHVGARTEPTKQGELLMNKEAR
jgi:hypothetical protein